MAAKQRITIPSQQAQGSQVYSTKHKGSPSPRRQQSQQGHGQLQQVTKVGNVIRATQVSWVDLMTRVTFTDAFTPNSAYIDFGYMDFFGDFSVI